ncbi:hypothetical protein ABZ816_34890 [Actinosynnema sp. NPDC047251]|uniref:hypothetical protein n=1 Tax=Saccharothrix espanaensis TaxID=103731 RepID=UPI0011DDB9C3|nr:hypothetical protein [Saccharothrix espanaensis]
MERILSPGELLDARHEVVPFHGRVRESAAVARWRDGAAPAALLLLHGPSGVGKTRLADRFADDVVRVVDDADLVPWRELVRLLGEPVGRARVLLVARRAGWWWSALRQRAGDLDYAATELALTPCPEEHAASFASACAHFADFLGRPRPEVPTPAAGTFHDLHLAALAAVHGSSADDPVELVRWLSDTDPAAPATRRLAEDVLAVTLLDDRIEPERTPDALETLLRAAERWPHALRRAERLFAADPGLVALVGAAPLTVLAERPEPARAVARQVFDDPRFHGDALPAVLTRTLLHDHARSARKPELAELHGTLGARAALAALREEALEAARTEVALYRELVQDDPGEYRSALADAVGDLGLRLIAVGRDGAALAASEEAVALCREVAADDQECTPQLAAALDRLALGRAALCRRDAALAAVSRAALLYQELHRRNPALFRLDFAKVTHHLAVRLFEVDRQVEAGDAARWAVLRWRQVADADPRYEAEFARTLTSVAALLSAFGLPDDAASAARESITVLRRLASANPRDFEPELAAALAHLGAVLHRSGRRVDALAASREAVGLWRAVGGAGLAAALGEQVDLLAGPERVAAAAEAVELLRPLAIRSPLEHQVDFAVARSRLARLLFDVDPVGALRIAREELAERRRVPRQVLVSGGGKLAVAWRGLSDALARARHGEPALAFAERVADLWRDLVGRHRGASVGYPVAVHRTAELLRANGNPEALSRARRAVLAWRLTRTPDELAAEFRYADALSLYARLCAQAGEELDRALPAAHRAVLVLRDGRAAPDRLARAVEVVDAVVRAHDDPQAARARTRAAPRP